MKKLKQNKLNYWPELKEEVDAILLQDASIKESKMFGYPAYYVNKKLAICHYDEGIALKLPENSVDALMQSNLVAEPFCPMGKKMGRNWVIIFPKEPSEIRRYEKVLFEAVSFVANSSSAKKMIKKKLGK